MVATIAFSSFFKEQVQLQIFKEQAYAQIAEADVEAAENRKKVGLGDMLE